jgi:hypothetical protein
MTIELTDAQCALVVSLINIQIDSLCHDLAKAVLIDQSVTTVELLDESGDTKQHIDMRNLSALGQLVKLFYLSANDIDWLVEAQGTE